MTQYSNFLQNNNDSLLADICATANARRTVFSHRLAVTAANKDELVEQLSSFAIGGQNQVMSGSVQGNVVSKLAFLFTGQGSQYAGMGGELYDTQPTFRQVLDHCNDLLKPYLDYSLLDVLYPEQALTAVPVNLINETAYTQPALFAIEYALAKLWQSWGIQPDLMLGHSVGEYVAACVAGIFSLEDGLRLIAARSIDAGFATLWQHDVDTC